jgi:hypothetical protein
MKALFCSLLLVCTVIHLQAQKLSLSFDATPVADALEQMSHPNAKNTMQLELPVFLDPAYKNPVPPNSAVSVAVVPLVPAGKYAGRLVQEINPAKINDANKGCVAKYDSQTAKIIVTLTSPYLFQDPSSPSSTTWNYKIDATITAGGSASAAAHGEHAIASHACISYLKIISKRTGKQWFPKNGDHYNYNPETIPKDWQLLGDLDKSTIYGEDGAATFKWKPDAAGKSIEVLWQIDGDDQGAYAHDTTEMVTEPNPCRADEPPSVPSPTPSVPPQRTTGPTATPKPTMSVAANPNPAVIKSPNPCDVLASDQGTPIGIALANLEADQYAPRKDALNVLGHQYGSSKRVKSLLLTWLLCPNRSEQGRINGIVALTRHSPESWDCELIERAWLVDEKIRSLHPSPTTLIVLDQFDEALQRARSVADCYGGGS